MTDRILFIEDDPDISKILRIYFDAQGYEALVESRGDAGLETCFQKMPNVVVLDIRLPDLDGYEVCKTLRSHSTTKQIPIIFLTQKDEQEDKIAGLKLGADDYITKPFDIEELKLRVEGAIRRAKYVNLTHPTTGLPGIKLIEEAMTQLLSEQSWAMLIFSINQLESFKLLSGISAYDDVLRFLGELIIDATTAKNRSQDFVGHTSSNDFVVITARDQAQQFAEEVKARFDRDVEAFYSLADREQGYSRIVDADRQDQQVSFMSLSFALVTDEDGPFDEVRQIFEVALFANGQDLQD